MAAIEIAKRKIKSGAGGRTGAAPTKNSNDDGWSAIADPWGTSRSAAAAVASAGEDQAANGDESSRPINDDDGSYSEGSSYTGDDSGDEVDGTSPATIDQVSELLNCVYGTTSVAGQIDRVSTIMRAYEGREVVLLELLETKALIKANADSNKDLSDMPMFLWKSLSLNVNNNTRGGAEGGGGSNAGDSSKKLTPQTPASVPNAILTPAGYALARLFPVTPIRHCTLASTSGG